MVIDAVTPVPEARRGGRELAAVTGSQSALIEIKVGDLTEHRRRIESRLSDIDSLTVPTWLPVIEREYRRWDEMRDGQRLELGNVGTPEASLDAVLAYLASRD